MPRRVLDPVHGYIVIPKELNGIVDSPPVQRLRGVSQTALASMVYPSATGTRFEHALGVMHLSRVAFESAWENSAEETRKSLVRQVRTAHGEAVSADTEEARGVLATAVAAVGLLHDVGHPPFSHALEDVFKNSTTHIFADAPALRSAIVGNSTMPFHEIAGREIVIGMRRYFRNDAFFELFKAVYLADPDKAGWQASLRSIIAGIVDVDRIDYLLRDSLHAGTEYGRLDVQRLIAAMEFRSAYDTQVSLVLGLRAQSAAELLLVQRLQAFRWVYRHPRVVGAELFLRRALQVLDNLRNSKSATDPERSAVEYLRQLDTPLNYIGGDYASVRISGLSLKSSNSEEDIQLGIPGLEIDFEPRSFAHQELFDEVHMSVTDAAVQRFTSNVALAFRHLAIKNPSDDLQKYLYYYDASLRRSGNLYVPWKKHAEYADVAQQLLSCDGARSLIRRMNEDFASFRQEINIPDAELERLEAIRQECFEDPLLFFNFLGYSLVAKDFSVIREQLNANKDPRLGLDGLWDFTYIGRQPNWRSPQLDLYLYGKGDTAVSLEELSPLVASVTQMERRQISLFAFFLGTSKSDDSLVKSDVRKHLRDSFVGVLNLYLRDISTQDNLSISFRTVLMKVRRAQAQTKAGS